MNPEETKEVLDVFKAEMKTTKKPNIFSRFFGEIFTRLQSVGSRKFLLPLLAIYLIVHDEEKGIDVTTEKGWMLVALVVGYGFMNVLKQIFVMKYGDKNGSP